MTGLVIADRVKETTATTGTGTINLAGAATQFQSFISAVGTGNQCNYCLLGGNGTDWEVGVGTVTSGSPNTLSRTNVLASSNSGSLISLTGTSTVFLTEPAWALQGPPMVKPPIASAWTQKNFVGTTSLTDVPNGVLLQETLFQNSDALRLASVVAPTAPYTIDAVFGFFSQSASSNNLDFGWSDGTKFQIYYVGTFSGVPTIFTESFSNVTTPVSNLATSKQQFIQNNLCLRIADDGTNAVMSISLDGINFVIHYTVAKSSGFLGPSGYTNVVWGLSANTGGGTSPPPACMVTLRSWYVH